MGILLKENRSLVIRNLIDDLYVVTCRGLTCQELCERLGLDLAENLVLLN